MPAQTNWQPPEGTNEALIAFAALAEAAKKITTKPSVNCTVSHLIPLDQSNYPRMELTIFGPWETDPAPDFEKVCQDSLVDMILDLQHRGDCVMRKFNSFGYSGGLNDTWVFEASPPIKKDSGSVRKPSASGGKAVSIVCYVFKRADY